MADEAGEAKGAEAAHARLNTVLEAMVGFMVARPEAGEFVQFVLRELSQPGARSRSDPSQGDRIARDSPPLASA